jgi:hypothetical protein
VNIQFNGRNGQVRNRARLDVPLFPMHALLSDQPLQVVRQTSTTEGERKLAPLVDSIVLSLDDKVGERVDEFAVVVERVEDGRSGRLRRHG